jgi:glycosyltransferase involved in cell wall biosynthesis
LKIAFAVDAIGCGGVETFLFRLHQFLNDAGHEITLVACARRGDWWDTAVSLGIECACLPLAESRNPIQHAKKVGAYIADRSFDCVLLNHSVFAQASLGMLPDHSVAAPVIHNDADHVYKLACSNPEAWNFGVAVSPKASQIARDLVPGKTMGTIPHGVPLPATDSLNCRERIGDQLKLLFVGRLSHWQKGIFYLPRILRDCLNRGINSSLTIVGEGYDAVSLRDEFVALGVSEAVSLNGAMSPETIYQEMLEHHILLMPSHFEGLGLVALEAQACGCVPIVSRLPGVTDVSVIDGHTGMLVDVGNVEGFVGGVEKLYRNPALWASMGKNGHDRVEREFSVDAMGAGYLQLINDAIDGKYPLRTPRSRLPKIDTSLFSRRDRIVSVRIGVSEGFRGIWPICVSKFRKRPVVSKARSSGTAE